MPDNLTREQRSLCMSRIKGRDTSPERALRSALHRRGWRFRKHAGDLPGRPDIVFRGQRIVVFVDGGFWHGYRFSCWQDKVSEFWHRKIGGNVARDRRNFRRLRSRGWRVIRIWQHQIETDLSACVARIEQALTPSASRR